MSAKRGKLEDDRRVTAAGVVRCSKLKAWPQSRTLTEGFPYMQQGFYTVLEILPSLLRCSVLAGNLQMRQCHGLENCNAPAATAASPLASQGEHQKVKAKECKA